VFMLAQKEGQSKRKRKGISSAISIYWQFIVVIGSNRWFYRLIGIDKRSVGSDSRILWLNSAECLLFLVLEFIIASD
jgi:hypothetical protein